MLSSLRLRRKKNKTKTSVDSQKSYLKFGNPRTTFENTPIFPPKNPIEWEKGASQIVWVVESLYFCYIGPYANFQNPRSTFKNTPPCPTKKRIFYDLRITPSRREVTLGKE